MRTQQSRPRPVQASSTQSQPIQSSPTVAGTSAGPGSGSGAGARPFGPQSVLEQASAHYDLLKQHTQLLSRARVELDRLLSKGLEVTPEDVIDGAAKLIGHGADPKAMASLLSQMPTSGGEALAAWVESHDAALKNSESQSQQMLSLARHQMGTQALRLIALASGPGGQTQPDLSPPGSLGPQAAGAPGAPNPLLH